MGQLPSRLASLGTGIRGGAQFRKRTLHNILSMQRLSMLGLLAVFMNLYSASALSAASSSSGLVNASDWTPSARNCTSREIDVMRKLYVGVAANTACAGGSTVDKFDIYVSSECTSMCRPVLQNLEEALPDCYYYIAGYENSNKKHDAYSSLAQCGPRPAWVRFHSTKAIIVLTPSSASGSAVKDEIAASQSASGSEFVGSISCASTAREALLGVAMVVSLGLAAQV